MSEGWGDRVTVVLHNVPETEDFKGGFEAVTMMGVSHNISITRIDTFSSSTRPKKGPVFQQPDKL